MVELVRANRRRKQFVKRKKNMTVKRCVTYFDLHVRAVCVGLCFRTKDTNKLNQHVSLCVHVLLLVHIDQHWTCVHSTVSSECI